MREDYLDFGWPLQFSTPLQFPTNLIYTYIFIEFPSILDMTSFYNLFNMLHQTTSNIHKEPLKTPLRDMVIVHPDADQSLDDNAGKLRDYVLQELVNVQSLVPFLTLILNYFSKI